MKYITPLLGSLLVIASIWAGTVPNVLASDKIVGGEPEPCLWCLQTDLKCFDIRVGCGGTYPTCIQQTLYETGDTSECSPFGSPCQGHEMFKCWELEGEMCGC